MAVQGYQHYYRHANPWLPPQERKTARMALVPLRLLRFIERTLLAIGCGLVLIYAGWQIHSFVMYRAGLSSFRVHQRQSSIVQAARTQLPEPKVDFALWSVKRVQAYKDSLVMKVEPPIAVLSIPKVNIEVPVYNGTDDLTLNRGAGRIEGTAAPGESGNIGIAGHRDGFFRGLKDIHVGDQMQLAAGNNNFVYRVDDVVIVAPSDVSVLKPRPISSLTLVTCYPFYFFGEAPQRYIVHASLVDNQTSTASSLNSAVQPTKSEDMP
jgi:sortase A